MTCCILNCEMLLQVVEYGQISGPEHLVHLASTFEHHLRLGLFNFRGNFDSASVLVHPAHVIEHIDRVSCVVLRSQVLVHLVEHRHVCVVFLLRPVAFVGNHRTDLLAMLVLLLHGRDLPDR